MTKLLDDAISRLRKLPDEMQDTAARQLIQILDEEPEPADLLAIAEARHDFTNGDFVRFDQSV
jgi:hypothetical protein